MRLKAPPPQFGLEAKRQFYIEKMRELDLINNELRERIQRMSSDSAETKDNDFHKRRKMYAEQIRSGRKLREAYRLRVRRMKETQKNQNRAVCNGGFGVR